MPDQAEYLEFADFRVDIRQRRLLRRATGEVVPVTAKVFDTLLYFVEHPGELLDKDRLLREIWPGVVVEENSLTQNVSALRQALGEAPGSNRYILTVPRRGYRFVAEVAPGAAPAAQSNAGPGISSAPRRTILYVALAAVLAIVAYLLSTRMPGRPASSAPQTLAVLPFKPLVAEGRDESLELGMTDSLIVKLSAMEGVVIHPLSSVRRFAATDQDPLAAGRALGAQAVLDGLLQLRDGKLRVSARLLDVSTGQQLWAGSFDEPFTTIFGVQDAITARVSEALRAPLSKRISGNVAQRATADSEAYLLYANGRLAWSRLTEPSLLQAISYFERAIERDPRYALAHSGLSDSYAMLGVFGMRAPREVFPLARTAVEKALEIDPDLAAAHATLGHIKVQFDLDWNGGMAEYSRAIELDPAHAPTYHYRGILFALRGDIARSLADLQRAQQLEPLWIAPRAATGNVLVNARRYGEAIEHLTRTLALDERANNVRAFLGRAYLHSGDPARALEEFRKRDGQVPGGYRDVPQALAMLGRRDEALAELQRVLEVAKQRHVQSIDIATIYSSLGDTANALRYLEQGYDDRSTNLGFIVQDPSFDKLHAEPRFVALVERVGVWQLSFAEAVKPRY